MEWQNGIEINEQSEQCKIKGTLGLKATKSNLTDNGVKEKL